MINGEQRFPPELRTMSVVPRWSIVWTLMRDTVANHSFYVAFYTHDIARLIGWQGSHVGLLYRALVHDCDETISGDICAPVKTAILDQQRASSYIQEQLEQRLPGIVADLQEIRTAVSADDWNGGGAIIKAADKLDALLFLIGESRLGNNVVTAHLPHAWDRFKETWWALPAPAAQLQQLYDDVMMPSISRHSIDGGYGNINGIEHHHVRR
jgi:5'-deoxynucleotidase